MKFVNHTHRLLSLHEDLLRLGFSDIMLDALKEDEGRFMVKISWFGQNERLKICAIFLKME